MRWAALSAPPTVKGQGLMSHKGWAVAMTGARCALVMAFLSGPVVARAQGVTVALIPATQTVAPGADFDLELRVTVPGSKFNGFDAAVSYDSNALTLLATSPTSLQEGGLMTGACDNQFHRFLPSPGFSTMTDVLLCAGVSVTGPGQIYKLRFRASSTPQTTTVSLDPGVLKFYDAGLYVNPVNASNAIIGIGTPVTGVKGGPKPGRLTLTAAPNPSRGSVLFTISPGVTGPESLTVRDGQGRVVRKLIPTGRQIAWNGLRETGEPATSGSYFVTLEAGGRSTTYRFSLLR